jgi:tight adherence protein C
MESIFLAALMAGAAVVAFFMGIDLLRGPEDSYIRAFIERDRSKGTWKDFAEAIGPYISNLLPIFNMDDIEQQLMWAGRPYGLTATGFVGVKFMSLAAGTFLGLLLVSVGYPAVLLFAAMGLMYLLPDSTLKSAYQKRQRSIYRSFPGMISLLSTAVHAGVELGPSLELMSKRFPGPLGDEMRQAWKEMATGRPRSAAMRALGKRTGVAPVERFFETIISAEERGGVNISEMIDEFRDELISSQKRKAQEEAKKVPTKMLLPMFLCVFIPTVLLILVPAVLQLLEVL